MMMKLFRLVILLISAGFSVVGQGSKIITGAEQFESYLPLIEGKNVGLVVNHTSMLNQVHLVDFLLDRDVDVVAIFAPEHGFRGEAAAGEEIKDGVDKKTGIKVVSLYGENKKPAPSQLKNIDVLIFDIQDVGCRFYTYISTLHYVIESCAENDLPLIVLDRPNPNGDYVAGPVLQKEFRSFVGLDPIPIVHGCTVGELALMINGEKWCEGGKNCNMKVIPVLNYTHETKYELPVLPSPNLPNYLSVRLYPSLCFFEATSVSVGRGTDFPFQVLGGVRPELGTFKFTPVNIPGVAVNPPNEGKLCYGFDLRDLEEVPRFTLKYFLDFYNKFENKSEFITRERWFNLLAGNDELLKQIKAGESEANILNSLKPELEQYKSIRKKYLLYPDFE
ncbi:MAG: DUF1343 domain-containing protein [Draconibacterium sp.]